MEKLTKISKIEEDILKIAEQFASKNKRLNIRKLQLAAKSQLNYSVIEISQAIYNLILNKLIFPEKKLNISNVLSNKKRKNILDFINENPGSHLRELRDKLNLNPKVANWHLKVLENFGMVYRKQYLKYRTYFPSNFKKGVEEPLLALKNENSLLIFKKIFNLPNLDLDKLKGIVDLEPKMIKYHLERLISSGIIKKEKNFYIVAKDKLEPIQKYIKVELKEEIEPEIPVRAPIPIKTPTITKPPPLKEEIKELINVKREYDYVGGGIRFKIAVQNISNTVITDINVVLVPTSQYEIPERVKVVDILKPGESRGIDFDLIPLTCGSSKVFGSVSYIDPFGNPHTATVTPKEIQIKCPLVQPKILTEIELLKTQLQKSSAKIPFKIDNNLAFDIIIDQISALDLSEINIDKAQFLALYSGIAKVTADNMIIESTIKNHDAILTVWTKDLKQATGFLAYLKNLIQMAFDTASKLAGKTEKISQKILDS
ncbi:MAG: winged helix-turn-helix transcriptional regulator, partial [Promethearchaeota archaeon]